MESLGGAGVGRTPLATGVHLLDDLAQNGIGRQTDSPADTHTDLTAGVPTKYRPILDQGNGQPESRCRNGRATTGHTASYHNQIEPARFTRLVGQPEGFSAKRGKCSRIFRWDEMRLTAQHDGIAAALEASQIVQGERGVSLRDRNRSPVMPGPIDTSGSEDLHQRSAIDEYLKLAGRTRCFPAGHPIFGANKDAVLAWFRQRDGRDGIGYRGSQTVGQ